MINYSGNKITLRSIICIVLIINISCNNSNPKKDKIVSKEGMIFIPGGNFEMEQDKMSIQNMLLQSVLFGWMRVR